MPIAPTFHSPPRTPSEPAEPASPQQNQVPFIDLEARQVEEWAQQHAASDSDAEGALEDTQPKLFVCSGPWGSMRTPTAESQQQYEEMLPQKGKTAVTYLRAACGTRLGPASFAITCTEPRTPHAGAKVACTAPKTVQTRTALAFTLVLPHFPSPRSASTTSSAPAGSALHALHPYVAARSFSSSQA